MSTIYDKLNELYPELNSLGDTSTPITINESIEDRSAEKRNTEEKPKQKNLAAYIQSVNKNINLTSFEDNKWIRSLNKIISTLTTDYKNDGATLLYVGATPKVGASTVSYWTARLLASFDRDEKCLYISLTTPPKTRKVDIIDDLINNRYSVDDLVGNLATGNLNHLTIEMTKSYIHAPATPRLIAQIIKKAKSNYQWIIIDSPPLFSVPGMYPLASETNGVILVARAQTTRIPTLNAISKDLEESGANLLGVILNRRIFPLPNFLMKFF